MATQDTSPSLIIGQQWSSLTDLMSSGSESQEDEPDKDDNRNASDSMKLGRHDMGLFGFCPSREEFSLVVCEKCKLLVKPQALKQHIETRHGSTNLSSLGAIPASALNSELGKKLLMPLPSKSSNRPSQVSKPTSSQSLERQSSGTFKPMSSGRPPTKASLKQVPPSVKTSSAPLLGVSMKISPIKSVKSGNRIASRNSTPTVPTPAISNPVVKVEKLSSKVPAPSAGSKSDSKPGSSNAELVREKTSTIIGIDSSKISTLMNGSLKSSVSYGNTVSVASSSSHVTVTKTSTDTPVSTRSVTTLVTTTTLTKPVMIAPVMTISSAVSMTSKPATTKSTAKGSKDQKEKKNLPCKDREYDANKHCGVRVAETGKHCTRSLTCKTHALSLRRAVSGRSKSFDDLLKEHKAANDAFNKAKANNQATSMAPPSATPASSLPGSSPKRVLISQNVMNPPAGVLKQHATFPSHNDSKMNHVGGVVSSLQARAQSTCIPTTTTKPRNVFQRFSSSALLPPVITVKEESVSKQEPAKQQSHTSSISNQLAVNTQDTKPDPSYLPHHPKPMAVCQFGGRLNDRGSFLFSRKMDYVRAAFLSALERQLNPPPHKKLCIESNLPKDSQLQSNSHDPYDFNVVDTSGAFGVVSGTSQASSLNVGANLVNMAKPTLKPKSKLPNSPIAAACNNPLALSTINLTPSSVAGTLSLSSAAGASPSGLALNWPVKSRDPSNLSRSPTASPAPHHPGKRKRSGSSGASSAISGQQQQHLIAVATGGNGSLTLAPGVSITSVSVSGNSSIVTQHGPGNNQQQHAHTGGFITIPAGVNLNTANLGQISTGPLPAVASGAKVTTTGSSSASSSSSAALAQGGKNNLFKDFNLVLTGIDSSSLVNGQYMNLTGAHLAELAGGQGQTLVLNNFNPAGISLPGGGPTTATSTTSAANIAVTATAPNRPAKRIRSSSSKSGSSSQNITLAAANPAKLPGGTLEGIKLIQGSGVSLPPNAVLMDGSSLQGAVLTSMALGTGGGTPTLVAITTSTAGSSQVLCAVSQKDSASQVLNSSAIVNGICASSNDKSSSNSQRVHMSKSHQHHHGHHQQNSNKTAHLQQQQSITIGSMLQSATGSTGGPSIAVPIPQGSTPTGIFKQGGTTYNLTKTVGGKLTMQPVSLTFPISVSQAGLVALTSGGKQQQTLHHQLQQQQQQQQQHTLLVAQSGGVNNTEIDASSVRVPSKSDNMHLQAHLTSSSSGNLIS